MYSMLIKIGDAKLYIGDIRLGTLIHCDEKKIYVYTHNGKNKKVGQVKGQENFCEKSVNKNVSHTHSIGQMRKYNNQQQVQMFPNDTDYAFAIHC